MFTRGYVILATSRNCFMPGMFHFGRSLSNQKERIDGTCPFATPKGRCQKSVGHLENPGNMREKEIRYIYIYLKIYIYLNIYINIYIYNSKIVENDEKIR